MRDSRRLQMNDYQSSVMTIYHDDHDECAVCLFLQGSRDESVMMSVIALLDRQLANRCEVNGALLKALSLQSGFETP